MRRKLGWVSGPNKHLKDKLYPILLEEAGKEFNATGIATVMLSAVRKYITETYKGEKDMTSLEAQALLANFVPEFIKVVVEDPEVAALAINEVNESGPGIGASLLHPSED